MRQIVTVAVRRMADKSTWMGQRTWSWERNSATRAIICVFCRRRMAIASVMVVAMSMNLFAARLYSGLRNLR